MTVPGLVLKKALYLQVRDALVERIVNGAWKPGFALPNENDLARELGVSTGTLRRALKMMEAERLLTRQQGRGTFVTDQTSGDRTTRFDSLRMGDGEHFWGEVLAVEVSEATANALECTRLRLRPEAPVYRIRRIRHHQGRVCLVEDATLPADLFPGLAAGKAVPDAIAVLAQEHGVLLGRVEEHISAGVPPAAVASILGVEPGTLVMVLDRIVLMFDEGRPVEWRLVHCHLPGAYYATEVG
jgi:GntR family transcriptional regulator